MNTAPDPSIKRDCVVEMQARAEVCNALVGGTLAMRAAGGKYLPKEAAESDTAYKARLNKTVLFPAYKKAVNTMVGKPFGTPIILGKDIPQKLRDGCENIDMAGRNLDTFAGDVFSKNLHDGIGWILAEYQNTVKIRENLGKDALDLQDERDLGLRPYLIHIPLDSVIGWRVEIENGCHEVTQFRYMECTDIPDGPWGVKKVERIRILEPGNVESYVKTQSTEGGMEWVLEPENSGPTTLNCIPLTTCYTGRKGFMLADPPLEDLAWLNVEHYQSRSDQRHILHFARVPMLFGKNLTKDERTGQTVVGPNRLITGGENSDLKVVEHSGAAIAAGRTDLQDIEEAMRAVAGEIISRAPGDKTATESDREGREGASQLRKWVWTFKDALEEAFRYMAMYIDEKDGGSLVINTEWDDAELAADLMTSMTNAANSGLMSKDTFIWNMQRKGALPPDRTVEQEKELISSEAPPMGGTGDPALSAMDRLKSRAAALAKANQTT